jgi:hypothetical protein
MEIRTEVKPFLAVLVCLVIQFVIGFYCGYQFKQDQVPQGFHCEIPHYEAP